ncbi:undecaprenyl/decaprenyl-phosphate alpha-N-acetylglucosaminyl 1-phosphate transferase [Corynebacterium sp. ES2794-CONJ1]|uniref:MraY family glycosyltransferase n=1 Tax=unclassified Corynebacterium TaxID=2624378 RepID=UPI00216725FD|nr:MULTISPECIES: MraY family glycosyltransferase [unclassified Corynebacterium]MCS4489827.1 undecaprenyl/decaprenyl-phosphate alpha-N-acetylglucosaminyl 1-phosphate transferase [Corynebacterium sp. ES2775-CONJ]MCS4491809.1 undecaprenyl/decaprenyl-phosphate alpha-N-acetylglucosaminyl 1-phosphate transferase [Corynebacterium sp. ES2715-CONJ3]MCS4531914.1 undecaprenyl/decaprenyl-phosphate alpha-N-acetylglucosaminyl 1-phosphate transferase [Corynebacterium sp. ES2730-CONJ]MCU9519315.1 undecaprenyl/
MGAGVAGVPMRELGLVLLVAASLTYLTTGIVRMAMVKAGRMGEIRERDVHLVPKPRLGGAAMFTGFVCAVLLAAQLPALTRGFQPLTPEMDAVLAGGFIVVLVGICDDLWELDALTKLVGQLVAAIIMVFLGLTWTLIWLPLDGGSTFILDPIASTFVTVLFTVTLINAINFIDGLDGLAAGVGLIGGGAILLYSLTVLHDQGGMVSAYPPAIIAAALVGICAGFLPHNFEPARIFMGDSGAMLIGLLLAAASTSASGKTSLSLYGVVDIIALLSPLMVVIAVILIPVGDLIVVVIQRLLRGQSPFSADQLHIHHRLLSIGHTHRRAVLIIYAWVSLAAFGAVAFSIVPSQAASIATVVSFIVVVALTARPIYEGRRERQPELKILIDSHPQAPPAINESFKNP